jgi:hypothetical protein
MKNPRHARTCAICKHPLRTEIEADFIRWESPGRIVCRYKLRSRNAIYRHAHALDLFPKRDRNIRAALGWIIEKIGTVKVTAAAAVAAVATLSKINAAGRWIDRSEHVDLNSLFDKMTRAELEEYAVSGQLPDWFERTVGGTATIAELEREGAE